MPQHKKPVSQIIWDTTEKSEEKRHHDLANKFREWLGNQTSPAPIKRGLGLTYPKSFVAGSLAYTAFVMKRFDDIGLMLNILAEWDYMHLDEKRVQARLTTNIKTFIDRLGTAGCNIQKTRDTNEFIVLPNRESQDGQFLPAITRSHQQLRDYYTEFNNNSDNPEFEGGWSQRFFRTYAINKVPVPRTLLGGSGQKVKYSKKRKCLSDGSDQVVVSPVLPTTFVMQLPLLFPLVPPLPLVPPVLDALLNQLVSPPSEAFLPFPLVPMIPQPLPLASPIPVAPHPASSSTSLSSLNASSLSQLRFFPPPSQGNSSDLNQTLAEPKREP